MLEKCVQERKERKTSRKEKTASVAHMYFFFTFIFFNADAEVSLNYHKEVWNIRDIKGLVIIPP